MVFLLYRKLWHEDERLITILRNSRLGIQIWHALVVLLMWLSVVGNQGLINTFDVVFDWDKLVAVVYELFGQVAPRN